MTDEQLDVHLDNILKASGSALKHYSMQKTKDDMRQALREALVGQYFNDKNKTTPLVRVRSLIT